MGVPGLNTYTDTKLAMARAQYHRHRANRAQWRWQDALRDTAVHIDNGGWQGCTAGHGTAARILTGLLSAVDAEVRVGFVVTLLNLGQQWREAFQPDQGPGALSDAVYRQIQDVAEAAWHAQRAGLRSLFAPAGVS
jgi:hypothetical protein